MKPQENKYTLITGATSGIGYELARVFARNGYNLIIVARTLEDLERTASELSGQFGVSVFPIAKDLFEPDAARELYEQVKSEGLHVNVLVNDAGQGVYGEFVYADLERQLR